VPSSTKLARLQGDKKENKSNVIEHSPTSSSILAQNRFPIATNKEAQIACFAENTILLLTAQASHSDGI